MENRKHKRTGIAILISDQRDFKTRSINRDKEECFIMIKKNQFIRKT